MALLYWEKFKKARKGFVYEDYNSSYEELLHKAKVPSLQIRRIRTMALETFKIVNKIAPVCKNSKYSFRYVIVLDVLFYC